MKKQIKKWVLCATIAAIAPGIFAAQTVQIPTEKTDVVIFKGIDCKPDANGYVLNRTVQLPAFELGAYYCIFTGGGHGGPNGNRVTSVAFTSMQDLSDQGPADPDHQKPKAQNNLDLGQFMLLKLNDGRYMALMPLAGPDMMSAFFVRHGTLQIRSGHFGTEHVKSDIPALVAAVGASPYEATHKVWDAAMKTGVVQADWRMNKTYPEMYKYLGWCSWEHYRMDISEEKMVSAFNTLEDSPVPFRWFMVDDGYLTHNRGRLTSYEPDVKKFPHGWHAVTDLKNPDGIRWMGLWRNMMGYKGAICLENQLNFPAGSLVPNVSGKSLVPAETQAASDYFYERMMTETQAGGFDFVKVDFQARALSTHYGMNNPVRSMYQNNMALEKSARKHMGGLLNCIAQTHVNVFRTKYSALIRSSKDYKAGGTNPSITYQSFANHLWLSPVLWGDLDMFHCNSEGNEQLAFARAISGGPVYVSDEPTHIKSSVLFPLCDSEGKIFRSDAPAVLLPESYFINPFGGKDAFRVIAPTANHTAALALFNYSNGSTESFVSAKDFAFAGEQLQPYAGAWRSPQAGLIAYEQKTGQVTDLSSDLRISMEKDEAKLFMLYPKWKGWAVIGRTDKYLSSATVESVSASDSEVRFILKEAGPFAVWSANGTPKMEGVTFTDAGNGLFTANIPVKAGALKCVVRR